MQLYSSALIHYPGSSCKVSIPISSVTDQVPRSTVTSVSVITRTDGRGGIRRTEDQTGGSVAVENMPDHSCYEAVPSKPAHYTSTAEILVTRPNGVERSVPIHVIVGPRNKLSSSAQLQRAQPSLVDMKGPYVSDSQLIENFMGEMEGGVDALDEYRKVLENNLINMDKTSAAMPCRNGAGVGTLDSETGERAPPGIGVTQDRLEHLGHGLDPRRGTRTVQITRPIREEDAASAGAPLSNDPESAVEGELEARDREPNYLSEVERQNQYLKDRQKYRFHIIPDGNCLYRAVCKAVFGNQSMHRELREETMHHIADHLEAFNPIIEGDIGEFLINAAQDGVWAGYPELLAMSQMLHVNIHLTTGGSLESPTVSTMVHYLGEEDASKPTIWLSWLSNGHYDALFDRCLPNPEYESWCRQTHVQRRRDEELAKSMAASLSRMYIEQNGSC
ncbi:OTU domain-containing protein 1 [Paramormyrops kingsleyae]|uniref:OTU domain-containing protein 1 n=1 Tax=Paramormyrops kingsleyae TaxID=1676925 RepID=A0A3B3QAK4_9TELE|nr:OTU domain-containing protein 1-like [Paramormyrops kingsleyae]